MEVAIDKPVLLQYTPIGSDVADSFSQNASQDTSRNILDMAAGAALERIATGSSHRRCNITRVRLRKCGDLPNRRRIASESAESEHAVLGILGYLRPDVDCVVEDDTDRASVRSGGLFCRRDFGYDRYT